MLGEGEWRAEASSALSNKQVSFGYYQWFGVVGVQAFIDSTVAWTDILDDRGDPIYPRYVPAKGDAVERVIPQIQQLRI